MYDDQNGSIKPEERLPPVIIAAFCYPICLICVGWTAGRTHWAAPLVFSAFFGIGKLSLGRVVEWYDLSDTDHALSAGTTLAFQGILNYLTDTYVLYAASVLAGRSILRKATPDASSYSVLIHNSSLTANDFMRAAFGAGAPLFSHGLFVNLGIDWGCTLLGLVSVLFIPLPFLLYKYGHIARQKSSKAQS